MNHWKRILSVFLIVCLIVSLFAGLSVLFAADNYVRNWGKRDTLCTSLSAAAEQYYTGTNAYETLKTLSGASSTSNSLSAAQNNQLFNALHTLMENTHTTVSSITYSSHPSYYVYTDCENGDTSGNMKLLWAGGYRTWNGTLVNREHVWCKSHATYVETYGGADLHHLRPASAYVNQQPHNNKPYGSANAHDGSTCNDENGNFGGWYLNVTSDFPAGLYEPPDNAKGDCARILLYVYTRWKQPNLYTSLDTSSSAYLNFVEQTPEGTCDGVATIESLDTLLRWCEEDPVDTWEMGRNDSIQSIQGNRNVFIDYPELAWYMFGMTPPADMPTPSGDAMNGTTVTYEITKVNVNNTSWGSAVITNGTTVTVTPKAGYRLSTATATSGTVAISGNVITVSGMTAATTVNVIFERIPTYTVSYSTAGSVSSTASVYQGSSLTLPASVGIIDGYTFLGWMTAPVDPESKTQPAMLTGSYTPTANTTLYALYSRTETAENPKPAGYTLTNSAPAAGESVLLARLVSGKYYALTTASTPSYSELTVTNGEVTSAGSTVWTVSAANSSNVYLRPNGASTYLHLENNALSVANGTSNAGISFTSNGDGTYKAARADGNRWIVTNGIRSFGCSGTEGNAAKLYVFKYHPAEAASTTYYTTMPVCRHLATALSGQVDATCTTDGYTGDTVCTACGATVTAGTVIPKTGHIVVNDPAVAETCTASGKTAGSHCSVCGTVLTAQATIPALGHSYTSEVTATATCTQNGVKTYTCSRCHDSYTESIQELGHSYDNGVVTTPATCGAAGVKTFTCSRCQNSYTQSIPATGNHSYNSGVITTAATCTTAGVKTYTCAGCGKTRTEMVAALGHNSGSATNTNNAEYHTYYCQNSGCDYSYTDSHDFTVTVSNYTKIYTCTDCGYSYSSKLNNYVVTYNDRGTTSSNNVWEGSSATPPATASTIAGYTFVGWSFSPYTEETTSVVLQTAPFTPTADVTLYAVYSRTEENEADIYTLVTNANQLQSGKKVVIAAKDYDYAMGAPLNSYYRAQVAVTKRGNILTPGSDVCFFTLGKSNRSWTLWDSSSNAYLTAYVSGSYYDLGTETTLSGNGKFTLGISSDGTASISTNSGYCNVRYVIGSYIDFACKSSTTEGYDCSIYIETPGTAEMTYYTTAPIVPETYTVSYCVLDSLTGSDAVASGNSVTLPESAADVDHYTFVGWTDGAIDPESETATVLTGAYTPSASVTLYAVYARTETGSGSASLVKMNSGDKLSAGDKLVIVANGTDFIMYQQTQAGSYIVSKTGGSSISVNTVADDKYFFDVSGSEGSWVLGDATIGYLYTNFSNNLAVSTENPSTWVFKDNEDGTFSLLTGGRYLSCRTDLTSSYANLFRLGGTGGNGTTKLDLYKYTTGAASVTYYTTNPAREITCTHPNTHLENALDATCTEAGFAGNTICDDCGAVVAEGEEIAALGHSYNENGICSVCSDKLINITSAYLRLDEDIDVIYTAKVPEGASATMAFAMNGKTVTVEDDGTHTFAFEGVNPQCMGDNISAVLTVTVGDATYTCTKSEYSVRTYCVNKLADETLTAEARRLVSDTLAYGAAAQTYMNYKTESLVNSGSDIENPAYSIFTSLSGLQAGFTGTAANDVCWTAAGLTLTDNVAMNFRFYAESIENLSVNVTINGRTQTFTDFTEIAGRENVYEISFSGIKAAEFGDNVSAGFLRNGSAVGSTVSYSVNTYVCSKQADSNTALAELVKALYNYGASALHFAE